MQNLISTYKLNIKCKRHDIIGLLATIIFLSTQLSANAYISIPYTIPQIVSESTNVVFGTITEVNTKRQTADIKVEQNLKGRSEFDVIRIRFDIFKGEADHRKEIARFLKQGEPIVVCYEQKEGRINSIAHTRGKWFQLMVTKDKERGWGRWGFTHFEVKLNQFKVSRRDSTPEFQKEVRAVLNGDIIRLFLLNRKNYQKEVPVISSIDKVGKRWIAFDETTDRNLPGLSKTDILWLGYRAIDDGRYLLNKNQEKRIRDFVKNGGIVIVSGQDCDTDRPSRTDWLPEPLKGVESPRRNDFQPTSKAGSLFKAPHQIRSGHLSLDDSWNGWNDKYEVLATTNNGKEIVVAQLRYGKGMYVITNLRNDSKEQVAQNHKMLENLVHFAVEFLGKSK